MTSDTFDDCYRPHKSVKQCLYADVQDGDVNFIVNALLSDCAWGRLEPGPEWVPVGRLATDR